MTNNEIGFEVHFLTPWDGKKPLAEVARPGDIVVLEDNRLFKVTHCAETWWTGIAKNFAHPVRTRVRRDVLVSYVNPTLVGVVMLSVLNLADIPLRTRTRR